MATDANIATMLAFARGDTLLEETDTDILKWAWDFADGRLDDSAWGLQRDNATALMALHLLAVQIFRASGDAAAGPVTREKVGEWEREYAVSAVMTAEPFLTTTKYGQWFLDIRRSRVARMPQVYL